MLARESSSIARAVLVPTVLVLALLSGCSGPVSQPANSPAAPACAVPRGGTCLGDLSAGTHVSSSFAPVLSYAVPAGWTNDFDTTTTFSLHDSGSSVIEMDWRVEASLPGCVPYAVGVDQSPDSIVGQLGDDPSLHFDTPTTGQVAGLPARILDVQIAPGASRDCTAFGLEGAVAQTLVAVNSGQSGYYAPVTSSGPVRLYLLDFAGGTFGISAYAESATGWDGIDAIIRSFAISEHHPSAEPTGNCPGARNGTCQGALAAGQHSSGSFTPALTFTVPEGWSNDDDVIGNFSLVAPLVDDAPYPETITVIRDAVASRKGCAPVPADSDSSPTAMYGFIAGAGDVTATEPLAVELGGLTGVQTDVALAPDGTIACDPDEPVSYLLLGRGESDPGTSIAVLPGQTVRLWLLEFDDGVLAIAATDEVGGATLDELDAVVRSFRFDG